MRVFEDAMTTMSTHDIAKRHGITPRTVYRWMKKATPPHPDRPPGGKL